MVQVSISSPRWDLFSQFVEIFGELWNIDMELIVELEEQLLTLC